MKNFGETNSIWVKFDIKHQDLFGFICFKTEKDA